MTDDDAESIGNVAASASLAGKFIIFLGACAADEAATASVKLRLHRMRYHGVPKHPA